MHEWGFGEPTLSADPNHIDHSDVRKIVSVSWADWALEIVSIWLDGTLSGEMKAFSLSKRGSMVNKTHAQQPNGKAFPREHLFSVERSTAGFESATVVFPIVFIIYYWWNHKTKMDTATYKFDYPPNPKTQLSCISFYR